MKNDEELKNELMRDFEANINVKTNKNNDYSFFETLDDDLFPDESVNSKIYSVFDRFIESKNKYLLQIIGLPGIGKTYQLNKIIIHWLLISINSPNSNKIVFCNRKNFHEIKEQKYVFIDGVNELNPEQEKTLLEKINLSLKTKTQQKFILTSWNKIETNFPEQETLFQMQSNPDVEKLLIYFDLENISEQNKYIFSTLTYRQLKLLFKYNGKKSIEIDAWDSMQKAFESLIYHEVKITNGRKLKAKSEKWKEFKNNFVLNNDNWPFIKKTQLDKQWEYELIRLAIIQRAGNEYYINNGIFLFPIILRKFMNKSTIEWLDEYIPTIKNNQKTFIDKIIIIVRYLVARKDIEAIQWLLNRGEMQDFPASKISETIFELSEIKDEKPIPLLELNIEKLKFDYLFSLFDFFPFIKDQTALNLVCDPKIIDFDTYQRYPDDSSKKYSLNPKTNQFKKLLIGVVMNIYGNIDESVFETWRLFNMEIFKGIKISKKYTLPWMPWFVRKTMIETLIIAGFQYFNLNIFKNKDILLDSIQQHFFLKTFSNQPKTEIKKFEKQVDILLNKWFNKDERNYIEPKIDNLFYITDKSGVLEMVPANLHRINKSYIPDKYKNKFLKPLITYMVFASGENEKLFGQKKQIQNFELKEISDAIWGFSGKGIQQQTLDKVKISRMIPIFLEYMLSGKVFDFKEEGIMPYLEVFEKKSKEVEKAILNICKNYLNIPFFLTKHNILDIYKKTIIIKNETKFYPIFLTINKNIYFKGYNIKNYFGTCKRIETFSFYKLSSNNWWVSSNQIFPFCPIKGKWKLNEKEFLFFQKDSKNIYLEAIYTSNPELLKRYYSFFSDTTMTKLPYMLGRKSLFKEAKLFVNHQKQKYFKNIEEYKKTNPKFGTDEYKKYFTKAELEEEQRIEEIENNDY